MNNGNAHVCRQCEKPLDPPEPNDVQEIAPRVEDAQPAGTPQKAVRKKRKKKTAQHRTSPSASKEPGQSNNAAVNGDALPTEAGAFAQSMSTLVRLDEIYNGEVEPTNPMCEQCTDTLIETVDQRIEETESELRDHEAFYEIVNKDEQEDSGEPSLDELRAELARVEAEDEALKKLCKEAMAERDAVFRKRDLMRKEQERLEKSYDQGQKEYMLLKHGWFAAKQEFDSALNQLSYQEHQRKLLTDISVPKAVFRIETKGHIGRINGFRFGKTKTIKTEWKEINFAWGEAVFLLDYLARMFEFEFEEYVLIPYKDTSRIEVLERRSKPLPLFILMQHDVDHMARYDQAQSAFAECISKLARRIEKQYPDFRLSNPISDGRIHEPFSGMSYSFALSANGPESWTRALRLILKNLDQMLNFYVDRVHDKRRQNAKSSV